MSKRPEDMSPEEKLRFIRDELRYRDFQGKVVPSQDAGKPRVALPGPGGGPGAAVDAQGRPFRIKQVGTCDARSVKYAARKTLADIWKRVVPAGGALIGAYKWLEAEKLVPPIRIVLFGMPPIVGLSLLVALLGILMAFGLAIYDERRTEWRRVG